MYAVIVLCVLCAVTYILAIQGFISWIYAGLASAALCAYFVYEIIRYELKARREPTPELPP